MKKKLKLNLLRTILLVAVAVCGLNYSPYKVQAVTEANKQAFINELGEMLRTVDTSTHNVYKYKLTVNEFYEITDSMRLGEYRWLWASYYSNMVVNANTKYSRINDINIVNADDNVLNRYEVLMQNVDNVHAGLKDDMTDLDKIIYFHNCIVEICSYKFSGYQSYGACGALGENAAVCAGYTKALNHFLGEAGIEAKYVSGKTLDHGWTYVKLDGEWYHVDATWDDTRSGSWNEVGHQHLLRNDAEFSDAKSHIDWKDLGADYKSTSTRFSDWFVHDLVGKMIFDNGYWYYVDKTTNSLMKAKATGEDMQVLIDGTDMNKLSILSVENGIITYKCKSTQCILDENAIPESEKVDVSQPVKVETSAPTDSKTETTVEPDIEEVPAEEEVSAEAPSSTPDSNMEYDTSSPSDSTDISIAKLKDYSLWSMCQYKTDTKEFASSMTHLGLNNYYSVQPLTQYMVTISDSNLAFNVNELDDNKDLIITHSLTNGTSFVTASNCTYVTVELYCPANEWNYSSKSFKTLFSSSGFAIGISLENKAQVDNEFTWDSIEGWRSGYYKPDTGVYVKSPRTRICLQDYIFVKPGATYQLALNNSKYRMLISQFDSSYNFISDMTCQDGAEIKLANNCYFLGISLYSPSLEWTLDFNSYQDLFSNGFSASLTRLKSVEEELAEEELPNNSLYPNIATVNMRNYSEWKIGKYNATTAQFESSSTRICLSSYYAVLPSTKYTAELSDSELAFCVYELNENLEIITSHNIPNGESFVTSRNCAYVAVELYCYVNEWNRTAKTYKNTLFELKDVQIGFTVETNPATVSTIEWDNISAWRTGSYKTDTGLYYLSPKTRVCLYDYLYVNSKTTYMVTLNNSSYSLLVVQYDEDYNFISSTTVADGKQFTTESNCAYLGVSIYSPTLEWTLNYNSYKSLFEGDFVVTLSRTLSIDDTDTPAAATVPTDYTLPITIVVICILMAIAAISGYMVCKKKSIK